MLDLSRIHLGRPLERRNSDVSSRNRRASVVGVVGDPFFVRGTLWQENDGVQQCGKLRFNYLIIMNILINKQSDSLRGFWIRVFVWFFVMFPTILSGNWRSSKQILLTHQSASHSEQILATDWSMGFRSRSTKTLPPQLGFCLNLFVEEQDILAFFLLQLFC